MISIADLTHTTVHSAPTQLPLLNTEQNLTFKNGAQNYQKPVTTIFDANSTFENSNFTTNENFTEYADIPYYIKATSMTFCIVIMCLGVIGNVMVPIVILKTKDMRNSTNIFLVNLSIADLMVLLVCTPTVLVEVNSKPETWVLGKELCLAVPFVELTVAHASVLTILAISFERYYAICEPLRAGYVCTKTRATLICTLAWFFAALFTSPILGIAEHHQVTRQDGTTSFQCLTQAVTAWQITFFIMVIIFLYILPLIILIVLYSIIAKNLITAASKIVMNKTFDPYNARARKQVILMLGTVVLCFFLCLMPYRILALWIIITPSETSGEITPEKWYNILYFSRIMLYINSAINPILYNLMSSKFRLGFCKICICNKKKGVKLQNRRAIRAVTNSSTTSNSFTRTTNSLRKLFGHRTSVDTTETEETTENSQRPNFFDRIFTRRAFVRQQSAPVCGNAKTSVRINRMRSEGNVFDVAENIDNKTETADDLKFISHSNVRNRSNDDLHARNSLRRSVLINSTRVKRLEMEADGQKQMVHYEKVDCVVGFYKSKSVDYELPESFV